MYKSRTTAWLIDNRGVPVSYRLYLNVLHSRKKRPLKNIEEYLNKDCEHTYEHNISSFCLI